MYKKHIGHFIMVSLKFFFDLDHNFSRQAYMMFMLFPFMTRLAAEHITSYIYGGIETVKEDIHQAKTSIVIYRNHWAHSERRETLANNFRSLRHNLFERNFR